MANASADIVAKISAAYPKKAAEAAQSCDAVGKPIVQRNAKGEVVSSHQKYRIGDGTIVPIETAV